MTKRIRRLTAALLAAALLAGCGGSGSNTATTASYDAAAEESLALASGGTESALLPDTATGESAQKIIYRADLYMESTDFDAAQDTLLDAVDAAGAWLEYSYQSGSAKEQDRRVEYTVRVPVENYSSFLEQAGQAGSVLNLSENAEDVTSEYIDVDARITSLEPQRDRLNDLAETAETTADLLEIENQLSNVQYQLESYTQQMRALEGKITYSTVDISLEEVAVLTPTGVTFGARLADAFGGGWRMFVDFVQGLVLTLVYLWPLLVIAAVVVGVVLVQRRKHPRPPKPPKPGKKAPAPPAQYGLPDAPAANAPPQSGKPDAPKKPDAPQDAPAAPAETPEPPKPKY